MNDADRLERLDNALLRLREAARGAAVLVEGLRDRAALEALGVGGVHIAVNRGRSLEVFVDQTVEQAQRDGWARIVVLMDWDRTGLRLQRRLESALAGRVPLETDAWRRVREASHAKCMEDVPADLAGLRRRVG